LEDRERIESLDDLLHPERARIGLAWRDRLQLPRFPSVHSCHVVKVSVHSLVSSNAALAVGVDAPETKSPERLRGPGSGWAQCGYAVVVSTCTSFQIGISCIPFFGKGAHFLPSRGESQVARIITTMTIAEYVVAAA